MHILLIKGTQDDYLLFKQFATQIKNIDIECCGLLAQGRAYLESHPVDLLMLDLSLSDADGIETISDLQRQFPNLAIIVLIKTDDDALAEKAIQQGAQDYLIEGEINQKLFKRSIRYALERKQLQDKLAHERNLLYTLIDSTPDYVLVKDAESRFILVNKAILEASNQGSFEDILGKTDFDFFPMEIAKSFQDDEKQILATGEPLLNKEESSIDISTGEALWFLTNKAPLRDSKGNIIGLVGISRNITRRKQAEDKLIQEHRLLRTLIDSSPDYIFIKDPEFRFLISNIAHAHAAHAKPEDMVGKTAFEVFPEDYATQFHNDDEQVIKEGKSLINLERQTIDEDGNVKTVLTTKIPLLDDEGQFTGLVGISRDITERKELESRTVELMAERERIQLLEHFINDISHDFRTPLTIINNDLYLMQKTSDLDKRQSYVQRIREQLLRLGKLLDESLHMLRLDQQNLHVTVELIELNAFLKSFLQENEFLATRKHLKLNFIPQRDACYVQIDSVDFTQAIKCLFENAINYTLEEGRVIFRTMTQDKQIIIQIEDTGIGIDRKDLPHIFERFYRADQARSGSTGGHGLGLSIARRIIEAHNGSLEVESTLDQGSIFSIKLPQG